jgi:hypothetical protein
LAIFVVFYNSDKGMIVAPDKADTPGFLRTIKFFRWRKLKYEIELQTKVRFTVFTLLDFRVHSGGD